MRVDRPFRQNSSLVLKRKESQLTAEEKTEVVTNCDHLKKLKFSRTLPYAFTEHGAIMAVNVLSSGPGRSSQRPGGMCICEI
jgi:hypothetical protein